MNTSLPVWFAAALLALTCAACGSRDGSPSGAASAPTESATPTSKTTPAAEPNPSESPTSDEASPPGDGDNVETYSWKDSDGYTFSVEASDLTVTTETNTADQKPGEGAITMTIGGQMTFTNTTPGRNASPEWVEVRPAWPLGSVFCKNSDTFEQIFHGYDANPFGSDMKFTLTPYCWGPAVRAAVGSDGTDGTLAEGESRPVALDDAASPSRRSFPRASCRRRTRRRKRRRSGHRPRYRRPADGTW